MIELLESVGPAIWRASWQGAVLALLVAGLVRCCGERLSPRWRFLLWGVVVLRLLVVVTPTSPWSLFNLASRPRQQEPVTVAAVENRSAMSDAPPVVIRPQMDPAPIVESPPTVSPEVAQTNSPAADASDAPIAAERALMSALRLEHVIAAAWLAGCVGMLVKLCATAWALRRRLSVCRSISDDMLLGLLEECRQKLGLKRAPGLLVTPDSFGPCLVGTSNPQIVLPELIVMQSSPDRLRHILAHELAHLVRGDLWTNWLLLAVRVLHWWNPLAWWTVREMQSERESACDELAFLALGDIDRGEYAATIVELAAGLTPSPLAPGLIGLFSSPFRLKTRIERLLRATKVPRIGAPVCVAIWLALAVLGLTDAMPIAKADPAAQAKAAPAAIAPKPAAKLDESHQAKL